MGTTIRAMNVYRNAASFQTLACRKLILTTFKFQSSMLSSGKIIGMNSSCAFFSDLSLSL